MQEQVLVWLFVKRLWSGRVLNLGTVESGRWQYFLFYIKEIKQALQVRASKAVFQYPYNVFIMP